MLYYLKENGTDGIRHTSTDDEEVKINELNEAKYWRSWAITQTGIYFVTRPENSPYVVKFYDFSNRQITEITKVENNPTTNSPALSITRDGAHILFSQPDANSASIMFAEFSN